MNGFYYGRRPNRLRRPPRPNGNWQGNPGPLFSFGVPFLLGATTASLLTPYYYRPYPYYSYPYYGYPYY